LREGKQEKPQAFIKSIRNKAIVNQPENIRHQRHNRAENNKEENYKEGVIKPGGAIFFGNELRPFKLALTNEEALGIIIYFIKLASLLLIQGNIFRGIGLAIIYVVVLLVRQIIEPRIVGAQLGQHPVVTLIAIYIGFLWMGVFGMILLPIFTNILIALNKSGTIHLWN